MGVLAGASVGGAAVIWLAVAGVCLLSGLAARYAAGRWPQRSRWVRAWGFSPQVTVGVPLALLPVALCLGAARFVSVLPQIDAQHVAFYRDGDGALLIEGVVIDDPDVRDTGVLLTLQTERLRPLDDLRFVPVSGNILLRLPPGGRFAYGDRLRVTGWLSSPFETESFSYKDYLARQDIHATFECVSRSYEYCAVVVGHNQGGRVLSAIYTLRSRAGQALRLALPNPDAALLTGILLGQESGIPAAVARAFEITGTSHIIAISGYNFAIIAGLLVALFGRLFGRWRGMLAALLGIALYAALAGAGAGVVRAAIMGGMGVFAHQVGRRQHALNSLAFVAALMALFDPHVLWDVSFQLSFAATLGLVLYATPLAEAFERRLATTRLGAAHAARLTTWLNEGLLITLAAQLTTLPLMLYYFQRLSLISLLANPLILPVQPQIMLLGGLTALSGALWPPLGQLPAYLTWPFLRYTIRVVEMLSTVPLADLPTAAFSIWGLALFYGLLFGWTAFGARLRAWFTTRFAQQLGSGLPARLGWTACGLMAALSLGVWQNVLTRPDGRLHLTLLDVCASGRPAEALLIRTPDGRTLLIDGGPSPSALSDGLGRRLPILQRRLDWLVVAAAGDEQLTALPEVLVRYPPGQALWAGPTSASAAARRLYRGLAESGVPVTLARPGMALDLGQGARLQVLAIEPKGAILLLEWQHFRALLPVGMDFDSQQQLLDSDLPGQVTALLLSEGGHAALNSTAWITRWQPQLALLSVPPGDPYGRPAPETLAALQGYTLLRTDQHGWIELITDGQQLWVEVEHK